MTTYERRDEIIRILMNKGQVTMRELANDFGVTDRTIRGDITALTSTYPIETFRGNGGGVRMQSGYHPYNKIMTREQQDMLMRVYDEVDESDQMLIKEMVATYGTPNILK